MAGQKWAVKKTGSTPDVLPIWKENREEPWPFLPIGGTHGDVYAGCKRENTNETTWWPHSLVNVAQALTSLPSQTRHGFSLGAGQQAEWR